MTDPLSEMQSFEVEPFKIDFNQPPNLIQKEILKLPLEEQQYWIDKWMEQPEIREGIEKKNKEMQDFKKAPDLVSNYKKVDPAQNWTD